MIEVIIKPLVVLAGKKTLKVVDKDESVPDWVIPDWLYDELLLSVNMTSSYGKDHLRNAVLPKLRHSDDLGKCGQDDEPELRLMQNLHRKLIQYLRETYPIYARGNAQKRSRI